MNITLIHSIDPFHSKASGTDNYVTNLINYLVGRRASIDLIGVSYDSEFNSNLPYNFIPIIRKKNISGYTYILNLFLESFFIKIPRNSIIHAQQLVELLPFIFIKPRNFKVCTLHGKSLETIKLKNNAIVSCLYEIIEKFVINKVDRLIVVDESTLNYYRERYPYVKNIEIIPVGINMNQYRLLDRKDIREKYGFEESQKIILYVGRLEKEKNLEFLIKSVKIVKESIKDIVLVLAGNGREFSKLKIQSFESGINTIFLGMVEKDKMPEVFNCADVLAVTSLHESGPLVVLEAMACGIPVVSVEVGRIKEFIQNENTGIISSRDENEFALSLEKMLNKGNVGNFCRSAAEKFSFDITGAKTFSLYEQLLVLKA